MTLFACDSLAPRTRRLLAALLVGSIAPTLSASALAAGGSKAEIERGRYVVKLGGCNDCHTAGYAPSGGKVPESAWLMGDSLGFQGDWGTTYPSNLRIYMARLPVDQWVLRAHKMVSRPPMPWFTLHDMTDADLRAVHAFVRSLGPVGSPAPDYLPPGQKANGPVVVYPPAPPASSAPPAAAAPVAASPPIKR
ncbi:Cytochrome c mono-and diheme variant [Burkholderiales bacterium 8X]|nr:Cytochrome c mono-and diheme variant [Burkholderiales bacterium 8X]